MPDEEKPVVWTPRIPRPRFQIKQYACAKCGRGHSHFWLTSTVTPPTCEEK